MKFAERFGDSLSIRICYFFRYSRLLFSDKEVAAE